MKTMVARFEVQPDCSIELSPSGLKFLKDVFKKYDKVSSFKCPFCYFRLMAIRMVMVHCRLLSSR